MGRQDARQKKNGETRRETKNMERQDARQKKFVDETQDKKMEG